MTKRRYSQKSSVSLKSRRLKPSQLQQLAQAIELLIKAPSNDLTVIVEETLRAMNRNALNTQVVADLQEEGTENQSLQDEEGQFLYGVPQVLSLDGCESPRSS